jgi:hypothetical protein
MTHVVSFGYAADKGSISSLKRAVAQATTNVNGNRTHNHCVEAVLTDEQLQSGWTPVLKELGFKRVSRFRNDNSGNICNIFHYIPTRARGNDPWKE